MSDNSKFLEMMNDLNRIEEEINELINECECFIPASKEEIQAKELYKQVEYLYESDGTVKITNGPITISVPKDMPAKKAYEMLYSYSKACELLNETPINQVMDEYNQDIEKWSNNPKVKWLWNVLKMFVGISTVGFILLIIGAH